jgi:hypothetical protein
MGDELGALQTSPLAQRWRRALHAIVDVSLRAAYVRSELTRGPLERVAEALDEIAAEAERGLCDGHDLMAAALPALADAALASWRGQLRGLAVTGPLPALGRLLGPANLDAAGHNLDHPAPLQVPVSPGGRPLTLGERRALARRPSRHALDVLLRDPHPMVARALLDTPRLTEDHVVRMAARRPGRPEVLAEIARHPRWILRPRVRVALVCNPSTPPAVALPLLPLLRQPELEQVAVATDVMPVLRRQAQGALRR